MYKKINCIIQVALITALLWSCTKSQNQETFSGKNNHPVEENKDTQLTAELPIEIDSTNYIIFPVIQQDFQTRWSSYKIAKDYAVGYENLIFQDINTDETHFLSQKNITILNFNALRNKNNEPENVMLYQVIDKNYEKDDLAKISLYLSTSEGKNFTKISLEDYHVKNWKYIPKTKKVYFNAVVDTNKNEEIDKDDTYASFSVSITNFKSNEILQKELKTLNSKG